MAFGRKQSRIDILQRRVDELEERICPCASHEWKQIDVRYHNAGCMVDAEYKYKCRKCGKEIWDWR